LKNINRFDRDFNQSTWRHFKELVFNKIISDDVIRQFDERHDCNAFAKLKVPNGPFLTFKKSEFDELRKLCKDFKNCNHKKGQTGGSFIDFTKLKVPEGFDADTHDSCESFHKKDATKDTEEKVDPIKALLDKEALEKANTLKIKQRLFSKPNYFNSHIIKPKK